MAYIISSPQRQASVSFQKDINTTHLSLGYVGRRFELLLSAAGQTVYSVTRPDILRSHAAISSLMPITEAKPSVYAGTLRHHGREVGNAATYTHLTIAHWRDMRLALAADRNICYFAWEQDLLQRAAWDPRFGVDMLSTLATFDEVWTCAQFVADGAIRSGLPRTRAIPVPIIGVRSTDTGHRHIEAAMKRFHSSIFCPTFAHNVRASAEASVSTLDGTRALKLVQERRERSLGENLIFVTQGNPGDRRKNLLGVIVAFALFVNSGNRNSFLFVKIPPRSRTHFYDEISSTAELLIRWGWLSSSNIFIVPANFSDEELLGLYEMADFYVCAPIAEGQNIPLQEAAQCGCYPVSPLHTAMKEYLDASLVSPIRCVATSMDPMIYCGEPLPNYTGFPCDVADIADAMQVAVDTPRAVRTARVRELQKNWLDRYTFSKVEKLVFDET